MIIAIQHPWIFSKSILDAVDGFAFNIHFGKLPEYRGHHLGIHSILNGEKTFTTTCHWMVQKVDRGFIAFSKTSLIDNEDTSFSLQFKAVGHTVTLVKKLLKRIQKF